MITVSILTATICFAANNIQECYPILVGHSTPIGTFEVKHMTTKKRGYGGDILVFDETPTTLYAIHRLWLLNPKQHRDKRILSKNPKDHMITNGCINIQPEVYEKLVDCCSTDTLVVKE